SKLEVARLGAGTKSISDSRSLELIQPYLRILITSWAYDAETKVLFTSDSFTHVTVESEDSTPLLDSSERDRSTIDDVRAHLFATFGWLQQANTKPAVDQLRRIFSEHDVEVIAPDRGCILKGKEIVERHVEMVAQVLSEVPA